MSLQAILEDVEACVRSSVTHNEGSPEEIEAVSVLKGLSGLLSARVHQPKPRVKSPPRPTEASSPTVGLPAGMIERLGDVPDRSNLPRIDVKDLASLVAPTRHAKIHAAGDYDPDGPPVMTAPAPRR